MAEVSPPQRRPQTNDVINDMINDMINDVINDGPINYATPKRAYWS
jgi:uncharacterized lipoprotein YajG